MSPGKASLLQVKDRDLCKFCTREGWESRKTAACRQSGRARGEMGPNCSFLLALGVGEAIRGNSRT